MAIKFSIGDYARRATGDNSDSSFLGRSKLISSMVDRFQQVQGENFCYSGLFRNGKTSLVMEVVHELNMKHARQAAYRMVGVYYSLDVWDSTKSSLLQIVLKAIHEQLHKMELEAAGSNGPYDEAMKHNRPEDINSCFADYLALQKAKGTRLTVFLDEFQSLLIKTGCGFQDIAYLNRLSVNIVYVGRLLFETTLRGMPDYPSNTGVFLPCKQFTVMGFDDDDIAEYERVFLEQHNFDLSPYMDRIRSHCGRSPYLYAAIGTDLQDALDYGHEDELTDEWFQEHLSSRVFSEYMDININHVLCNDSFNKMNHLERLKGIFIGPRVGIRKNDVTIMREMGYIERFGEEHFAIAPAFVDWLRTLECTGALAVKIQTSERLLKHHIRKYAGAVIAASDQMDNAPVQTGKIIWKPLDRAILGLPLRYVPDSMKQIQHYGEVYRLDNGSINKYANYIRNEWDKDRPADLLEVLLLYHRIGILLACWGTMGAAFGGTMEQWRDRLIYWNSARNPTMHANDYLTTEDERACELSCDQIITKLGPLYPDMMEGHK